MTQEELAQLRRFHDQDLAAAMEWVRDDERLNEVGSFLAQLAETQEDREAEGFVFNRDQTETLFSLARLGLMTLIDKRFANES